MIMFQAAKIDFSDHGSTYSSSQALHSPTPPPPQLPVQGPPVGPPPGQIITSDGYRTLRGSNTANTNPLKSFTQLAGAPPSVSPSHGNSLSQFIPWFCQVDSLTFYCSLRRL